MIKQQYEYALNADKLSSYSRISLIFFAINIASLIFTGFIAGSGLYRIYALSGGGVTLLWLAFTLFRSDNKSSRLRFTPGYAFLFFLWLKLHFYWVAAIVLLLAILDYIARRPLLVKFTKEQIHYPSFPPKMIAWNELQNVVLKDGLLTIDFINNKVLQAEIEEETLTEEETTFNLFAQHCIETAEPVAP